MSNHGMLGGAMTKHKQVGDHYDDRYNLISSVVCCEFFINGLTIFV